MFKEENGPVIVNVSVNFDGREVSELVSKINNLELFLKKEIQTLSAALDALTAQVAQNTSVESSAVTLIQGIAAQLAAAGTDPAALAALQAQLNSSATALAAAVAANTPAAPAGS